MLFEMMDAQKQPPMLLIISDDPTLRHPAEMLRNRHKVVHVKSASDHQAALERVLAGESSLALPGGTLGHVPESQMVNAGQPTVAGAAVAAPLQEVQAVRRQNARCERRFQPYHVPKQQNPNLIPLGNHNSASIASQ